MTLEPTDQFVVQRDGAMKKVESQNLQASLEDTDLMVVARGTTPFKATGKEIKDSLAPADLPPTINSISLAGGPGFSGKSYVTTLDAFEGIPAASKSMKAKVTGELSIAGETSPITGVGANAVTYTATVEPTNISNDPFSDVTAQIACNNNGSSASITFTYPTAVDFSSITKIRGGSYSLGVNYTITFTDENGAETSGEGTTATGYAPTDLPVIPPTLVKSFTIRGNDGYAFLGFRNASSEMVATGSLTGTGLVLTLTDRTNLDNGAFVVGDEVTGYTADGPPAAFAPVVYTGTGGNQDINCGFACDFVWIKNRDLASTNHALFDTVRGATNIIRSDTNDAENSSPSTLSAFNSNGFTVVDNAKTNASGSDYVAWCWKASDTTVTNNEGTIESQVRAGNGFSIVRWTGTGNNVSGTVGHGLDATPQLIITKCLTEAFQWYSWHTSFAANEYINLNQSDGKQVDTMWNNTLPTNSVFSVTDNSLNKENAEYVAYCFAETDGSSFGSYTGNGSSVSAPVIDCGFQPAFVLVKRTDNADNWVIYDTARDPDLSGTKRLYPDQSNREENDATNYVEILSNGFTPRSAGGGMLNADGGEYLYAAFAAGDPPVTVEAISTTADEMTVSGGDWEVGQTVQNTVVNPQTAVPKSDEIVGVGTTNYIDDVSGYATAPPSLGNLFDGSTDSTAQFGSDETIVFTPTVPINFSSGVSVYVNFSGTVSLNNETPITSSSGGLELSSGSGTVEKITFTPGTSSNAVWAAAIEVDGVILLSGESTLLTLASDSQLVNFAPDYDVYQDSGYTAETSEITGVAELSGPKYPYTTDGTGLTNSGHKDFAGVMQASNLSGDEFVTSALAANGVNTYGLIFNPPLDTKDKVCYVYCNKSSGDNPLVNGSEFVVTTNGTSQDQSQSRVEKQFTGDNFASIYVSRNSYFYGLKIDDEWVFLDEELSGTLLTLSDATDLDVFEQDDVVQESLTSTVNISGWDINPGNAVIGGVDQRTANGANKPGVLEFDPPISASLIEINTRALGTGVYYRVFNEDLEEISGGTNTSSQAWHTVYSGDAIDFRKYSQQSLADNGSEDFFAIRINGGVVTGQGMTAASTTGTVTDGNPSVKVVSVKDPDLGAPYQMTVDGGSWTENDGQTVTCTYEAGTGTVGSTGDKEIILSDSNNAYPKRWVAGKQKYVTGDPTAIKSRSVFLEFTGSTVNGTAPSDPGFTPAPANLTLSFNDVDNPSGRTWDQDFPAGTKIETQVRLTNDSAPGGVDSGWSNEVTARKLSTDLSEQELQQAYAETAASLLSHKNRGDYRTGQDALEKRADLRIKMAELGLTKDQIKELGLE